MIAAISHRRLARDATSDRVNVSKWWGSMMRSFDA
jgi:hypothetical protein